MADSSSESDLLHAYVQADASGRAAGFGEFLATLKSIAADGWADEAREWAGRAVSRSLDYLSLIKLRKFLVAAPDQQPAGEPAAKRLRVAILGGPTTTQLRHLIEVFLAGERIEAEIYEGGYGLFRQEILSPDSRLDAFRPQVVFLATGARDVASFPAIDAAEPAVAALAESEMAAWQRLWQTCAERWNAEVIQNNFEIAPAKVFGHFSLRLPAAREHYLERLNSLMASRAPSHVALHDLRGLAAEAGAKQWFDSRFYFEFKMPCEPECLVGYAYSVVSVIRAIAGRSKKVLVLDLDNTLWGGTVGDLGPGGITIGHGSGEGEAYLAFQHYVLELQRRGVLLAVCSKNDEDKAREPFLHRKDMAIKLNDIAVFVGNWTNKAENLRSISKQLDLPLDSFVFVDDNPVERALARHFVPAVATPDMPADPAGYIQALADHRYFETIAFTREDALRGEHYALNAQRRELAARSVDLGSFLTSLDMRMRVEPVSELNLERVTQLINKSNQFNLTTRRYTLAEMRALAASPDWRTLTFSLRDSFSDNGLISVVLLRKEATKLTIDTWVMSCRVLQRGVERFVHNEIMALSRREGCEALLGAFIPTAKNAMVEYHYPGLGFEPSGADGKSTFWSLPVAEPLMAMPHFIQREEFHD